MNRMNRVRVHLMLLMVAALAAGCADGSTLPTGVPWPVVSVTVAPASISLAVGGSSTVAAEPRDQAGAAVAGAPVVWSSSDTTVATVSPAGVVNARRAGVATIRATSVGRSGTVAVTVTAVPVERPVAAVVTDVATLDLGVFDTRTIVARALDAGGVPVVRPFAWRTSDAAVATVDSTGQVIATGAGTALLTVTSDGREAGVRVTVTGQGWRLTRAGAVALPAPLYTATTSVGGVTRVDTTWVTGGTLRMRGERYELRLQARTATNGGAPVTVTFGSAGVVAYDVFSGAPMFHESDTWFDREPRFRSRVLEDGRIELAWNVAPNAPVVPLVFAR